MQEQIKREIKDLKARRSVQFKSGKSNMARRMGGDKVRGGVIPRGRRVRTCSRGGHVNATKSKQTRTTADHLYSPVLDNEERVKMWLQSSEDFNERDYMHDIHDLESMYGAKGYRTSDHDNRYQSDSQGDEHDATRSVYFQDQRQVEKGDDDMSLYRKSIKEGRSQSRDTVTHKDRKGDRVENRGARLKETSRKDPPQKQATNKSRAQTSRYMGMEEDEDEGEPEFSHSNQHVYKWGAKNKGECGEAWEVASNRSRLSVDQSKEILKSGFLDKPRSYVLVKQMWPHMNQKPRYVTTSLTFNQLNFCQFVGGECRTILKTDDDEEVSGRLQVLSKVAYLYDQCKDWEKARAAYFAMVSSIEQGEATWSSSFGHYDMMCPPKTDDYKVDSRPRGPRLQNKKEFYCKDFQKGDCTAAPPHKAWIRNNYENVDHYCLPCFRAKLGKLPHVPNSDECSQRK